MQRGTGRNAYVVSWFPAITETFVIDELRELRAQGEEVEVLPLFGARGGEVHSAFRALAERTHYHRTLSFELALAQAHWLGRAPRAFLRAWAAALRGSARSPKLLIRAPLVLLKAALLARRVEAMGARHVHAHFATHPALAAWFVRELTGVGYSFTVHAHDLYVDRAMLAEKVRQADFVVTISDFNKRLIADACGDAAARKVHVVRCGVDLAAFAPVAWRSSPVPTFACVASLRPYKGHEVLIEAAAILHREGFRFRVVLVGEGELRPRIEKRIARRGLREVVTLRGALSHEDIPAVLAGATAVVLPSVTARDGQMEGIPVALMEAMAAGVPVIATRLSGIPELVRDGDTGLLVPEGDPVALAVAMERLGRDPELGSRLARRGRRAVEEHHDLARNVGRLRELLSGVASSAAPSSAPREVVSPQRGAAG